MKVIRQFIVVEHQKNDDAKAPDRKLKANFGTDEKPEWKNFGSAWIKEKQGDKGSYKFLSVNLDKEREYKKLDQIVKAEGYVILSETDYKKLLDHRMQATGESHPDLIPF